MTSRIATAALLAGTALSTFALVAAPAASAADTAEQILVQATKAHHTADGVTGQQPGGGLIKKETAPKSRSSVTKDYIQKQAPAQSPFMLAQLLPGVVVTESDPYGLSNGGLALRGLDQTEMSFIWEGSPIADIGVYTTYPSEFVDNENMEDLSLQQGSSDIDTPTINGSGGMFTFHDRDPSTSFGGLADYGYGSFKYNREFLRLDTGLIGNSGIRAFISYSHQHDRAWRGTGTDEKHHVDVKLLKEWGQGNRISFVGAYQSSIQNSYTTPTLDQWNQYKQSLNFDGTYTPGDSNFYKLNRNPYLNINLSAPSHFTLTDRWTADITPYMWRGWGNGTIGVPIYDSQNYQGAQLITDKINLQYPLPGTPYLEQGLLAFQDAQLRGGVTGKTNYHVGPNNFFIGYWLDYSHDYDTQPYSPVNYQGVPSSIWGTTDNIKTVNGLRLLGQDITTITTVNTVFLGDELSLMHDKLKVAAGFKEAVVNRNGTNRLPGPQYKSVLNDAEPLPAISASYQFDRSNQIFASVSTNFRSPVNTTLYNTYSYLDGSTTFLGSNKVKDEYSISEELGYRYQGELIVGSITYFHYNFTNRQFQSAIPGTSGKLSTDINAGGQTSDGASFEIGTRPFFHVRPYFSTQYLHSTVDNNLAAGGDYLPTKGKTAVRAPRWTVSGALDYDDGRFFANYNIRYITQQYSTFMNDEIQPAFYEMGAAVGMRFHDVYFAKAPTIQLNLVNLTNNKFLSGVNSLTSNAKDTVGVYGTTIAGSSPSYVVGEGFAAIATVKTAF